MRSSKFHSIRIIALIITIWTSSSWAYGQRISNNESLELKKALEKEYGEDFEFSVKVALGDEIVFNESFGYLDIERSKPISGKTLFNIASITKSITAVSIMILLEENALHLDDTLGEFFEQVPESKTSISINHLLAHQSGLRQNYPLGGITKSSDALLTILGQELEFNPGKGFRYSNQNYQLLALIIEHISGTTYENFVRQNVLKPLNMGNTFFWNEIQEESNVAPLDQDIRRFVGKRNWGWIGSGGVFTTTDDLWKFWNGLYRNGFLSKTSVDLLFGNYYQSSSGIRIGYGFFTSPDTKWGIPQLWTRGTESWGHNAVIGCLPDREITVIVVTNSGEIDNDPGKTGNRLISDFVVDYLLR